MKTTIVRFILLAFTLIMTNQARAQNDSSVNSDHKQKPFFIDYIAGPYLFVDHIRYNSVFLQGARLGYHVRDDIAITLEYSAGQQEDDQNTLGTTHQVSLQGAYFLNADKHQFRPYVYAGGGFLEFKDFEKDQFGVGYYTGFGTLANITAIVKGFVEFRYLNIGSFDMEGQHELGVFWGARLRF